MNRYKKLVGNSIIFAIGNLGSKLITFFLVPLYTYYLSTKQYGTVDLIVTTLSMLVPIFTMSIYDAVLRFAMDKAYDKKVVISNALMLTVLGFLLAILIYPIFNKLVPFNNLLGYFYVLLFTQSINSSFLQFIRAIGKVKLFAFYGILNAFMILTLNIVFLVKLDLGIHGYLLSMIIADTISAFLIIFLGRVYRYISIKKLNIKLIKEMLLYSTPLIPNALMWWIMGVSDRYIISYFLGLSANGLYAIANKIPSLLNIVNSIFFQAWQLSAIEEVNSKDKSKFYSNVFNIFSTTMLVCTSIYLVSIKFIMGAFVSEGYYESWKYVPFLLLGVVFSSFAGFLGTNYIALKNTAGVFRTSIIGAIINATLNVLLIPLMGINGASISTMLSFAIIWILRIIETRHFVQIKLNLKHFILTLFVLLVQIYTLYKNISYEYIIQIILFIIIIIINLKDIKVIGNRLIKVVNKKFHIK
ncbi:oligosaccharide flippase family protein [Priestia megaterium]